MTVCSAEEMSAMPGYLTAAQMAEARDAHDDKRRLDFYPAHEPALCRRGSDDGPRMAFSR
jgi:hypothetical protein